MQIRQLGKGKVYRKASTILVIIKGMFEHVFLVGENFHGRKRRLSGQDGDMNTGGITTSVPIPQTRLINSYQKGQNKRKRLFGWFLQGWRLNPAGRGGWCLQSQLPRKHRLSPIQGSLGNTGRPYVKRKSRGYLHLH